jgi:oligopeptide/dipeptide ABC transporter, ATP-binding protein, C-terminal domain
MSYLFVSHDLNVVRLLCDRVLVMYLGKIVEAGRRRKCSPTPRHPYTRALVSAIPQADPAQRAGRLAIRRTAKPDRSRSPVCRFYGRCPQGEPRCASEMPPLRPAGSTRQVACHFRLRRKRGRTKARCRALG